MFRARSLAVAAVVAAIVLLSTTIASAKPVTWDSVDVLLHVENSGQVLLVSGTLPDSVPLPAAVELSVPANAQLQWAGEILGGPPANDPQVKYEVRRKGESDVYSFTMTKARKAQVEAIVTNAVASDADGNRADLTWVPSAEVPEARIAVRVPTGTQIVEPAKGASLEPGPQGYQYYRRTVKNAKSGKPVSLRFAYLVPPTAQGGQPAGQPAASAGSDSNAVLLVLLLAAAGLAIVLVVSVRRKLATKDVEEPEPPQASSTPRTKKKKSAVASAKGEKVTKAKEPASQESSEQPVSQRRINPRLVLVVATSVVILGVVLLVNISTGGVGIKKTTDTGISMVVGKVNADATSRIKVTFQEGTDPVHEADHIFKAFQGVPGVAVVTLRTDGSQVVEISYDSGQVSEQQLRDALTEAGYAPAAQSSRGLPAVASSGRVQLAVK